MQIGPSVGRNVVEGLDQSIEGRERGLSAVERHDQRIRRKGPAHEGFLPGTIEKLDLSAGVDFDFAAPVPVQAHPFAQAGDFHGSGGIVA